MDSREYQGALAALIAFAVDHADAPEARPQPDVAAMIDALMPPPAFERTYSLTDPPTLADVQNVLTAHARDAAQVYRADTYAAVSAACNIGMRLLAEVAGLTGETRAAVLRRVRLSAGNGIEVDAPARPRFPRSRRCHLRKRGTHGTGHQRGPRLPPGRNRSPAH